MIQFLRCVWQDIRTDVGRFRIRAHLVKDWPGATGHYLRRRVLLPWFGRAGANVDINEGVQFRNIQKMVVGNNVALGMDNFFQAGGGIEIGDNTILGPGVRVWSQNHVFADIDRPVRDQGYEYKKVTIGRDVWIGANTFIMPGAEIGDGCIISAGSVVGAKRIPPNMILAGNPARAIGKRESLQKQESGVAPEES
jgi:acetyltransferase-like isoleucine patch superfamily enzyme